MNRRLGTLAAALVTGAGVVVALGLPAQASPNIGAAPETAATTAVAPDAAILAALQRDLNLTAEQARERVSREYAAALTEARLRKQFGAAFGGAWLTADASALIVGITDRSQAGAVRAAGAQPQLVARSERALDALKAKLDANAAGVSKSISGWYVDVRANDIVVLAQPGAAGVAHAFVARAGVDARVVRVVESTESPRPFYDVRGGDAFYIGGGRCSIGFSVNGGYVTAGHCGTAGTPTSGYNQVAQGTFQGSSFPGNDYAWVAVNANWTPVGVVNNYSGGTVAVAGSTEAAVGASICRSGSTTGWHCGSIQAKNQTVNYPQGTVYGLTRTNVCAEPGDSGGSWLSGNQAQGVTSGGSGNCTSGGTTFYQPVNEILSAYGLTLVTSGGPPPPTGCSGYEFTRTGSLSGTGASQYQPDGSYYYSSVSGTHAACLDGPSGVDFDLYLQKWNGFGWSTVASALSPYPDETLTYSGTAGYYRYRVYSYSGSGSYTLGFSNP